MGIPLLQVDAFTDRPFKGNPAAVCLLDTERPAEWMQSVANEMNLAETAFVTPRADGWSLRWFTPTVEVDLCGHATLATAHALWETGRLALTETARFLTRSGWLTAMRRGDLTELDFPSTPPDEAAAFAPRVADAIGVRPTWVGRSIYDLVAVLPAAADVQALAPDMRKVAELPVRGLIVTARGADGEHDFVSRFFGPQSGVPEDPVTGSAHCALTPYWSAQLGRTVMRALQASPRTGRLEVELAGDRVKLRGHAVTVLRAELDA